MATFGDRLKNLRESRKITQIRLSTHLGISQEAISAYECKETIPNVDILIELASYFGVSVDYLLGIDNVKKHISETELSEFETVMINYYRRLKRTDQELVVKLLALAIEYNDRRE